MQTEIEAKSLAIDPDTLRRKLETLGATQRQPQRLLRRYNFDYPDKRLQNAGSWVRVRDEGDKITMSYKQLNDRTLHGKVNLTIDNFGQAKAFLEAIGLQVSSYQKTRRESWQLGQLEIELDEWPWVKPYAEIEGPDEASLQDIFAKLDLPWETAVFGSVEVVHRAEYDVTDEEVDDLPRMTFEEPVPDLLARKRRPTV